MAENGQEPAEQPAAHKQPEATGGQGKRRFRLFRKRDVIVLVVVAVVLYGLDGCMIRMPGKSFKGPLPGLTGDQERLRDALKVHVHKLASEIGERNMLYDRELAAAADYIEQTFVESGYEVRRQACELLNTSVDNLVVQIDGRDKPDQIVIVGAHYDSVSGSPGANDNATAIAAVLELARQFAGKSASRTLRFVAFVNEEPPYFQTEQMGSWAYAQRCRDLDDNIVAMIALDGLGCYSDEKGSQKYPSPIGWLYPSKGNFIGFIGNVGSRGLVRRAIRSFRQNAQFPSEGAALPGALPGVGWSDHWSFWQFRYPGIMVTDTLPFRYQHYHQPTDTPDKIDYDRMARVVVGMKHVVAELAE